MSDSPAGPMNALPTDGLSSIELPHHGIWVTDAEDRTVSTNATMRDMLGVRDNPVGRLAHDFFAPSERSAIEERQALQAFGVADEYETRLVTSDGLELPVLISASPRFDREGKHVGNRLRGARPARREDRAGGRLRAHGLRVRAAATSSSSGAT
jgi:PAS domain S-box-containing protein